MALTTPPGLLQSSQEDSDDPLLGGRNIGQYLLSMGSNVPRSGTQFVKDMASMLNPETYKLIAKVATDSELRAQVWEALKSDYESPQAVFEKMRTDPVGIASDIAGIFMGGGLVVKKVAGLLGDVSDVAKTVQKVAGGVERVGAAIDPLTQGARGVRAAATQVVPGVMGGVAGFSADTWRQAVRAGFEGGETLEEFQKALRNLDGPQKKKIADDLRSALDEVFDERAIKYRTEMDKIGPIETVDIDAILKGLDDLEARYLGTTRGATPLAMEGDPVGPLLSRIRANVARFGPGADQLPNSVIEVDKLKRSINRMRTTQDTGALSFLDEAYRMVKNQIGESAPEYQKIMTDYADAASAIDEYVRELRLGSGATDSQVFSRALSATRDQVNTAFGMRGDVLNRLDNTIFNRLSGAAMNPVYSPGVRGGGQLGTTLLAEQSGGIPLALAVGVGQSPRFQGELASTIGRVGRVATSPMRRIPESFQQHVQKYLNRPVSGRLRAGLPEGSMRSGLEQMFRGTRTGDVSAGAALGAARIMRPGIEAQREVMQSPSGLQGAGGPPSSPREAQELDEEQLRILQDALMRFDSLSTPPR